MADLDEAVVQAKDGDPVGVEALYRAYSDGLFAYLLTQVRRREDAEDLVGQTFLEALRDLDRFTGDAAGFRAWLFRIGHNRAVDLGRRLGRRTEIPLESTEHAVAGDDPEAEGILAAERALLRDAIQQLSPDQQRVIVLRLAAGLTAREIAAVVGKRTGAVKALQHRAVAALGRILGAEEDAVAESVRAGASGRGGRRRRRRRSDLEGGRGVAGEPGPYPAGGGERS